MAATVNEDSDRGGMFEPLRVCRSGSTAAVGATRCVTGFFLSADEGTLLRSFGQPEIDDMTALPLIVFDVNETLLDLETMAPTFERIFEDKSVMLTLPPMRPRS